MSNEISGIERRKFLCVMGCAGAAGVVLGSVPGCGGTSQPAGSFAVGTVAQHPVGLWKRYADQKLIVGRDATGFFAFSILCTHEAFDVDFQTADGACMGTTGCTSASTTGSLVCTSGHGSNFDSNGAVTHGPATSSLPHFQVTITGGNLTVNSGVTVAATTRVAG